MIAIRILAAAIALLALPTPALAGDYSLPFYDPGSSLSYGVDRNATVGVQLDWTGQTWYDTATHYGRVYDQHSGIDYPMGTSSPVAAARAGTVLDIEEGFGTSQFGPYGNFVRLGHADGIETIYYHLAFSGALVDVGDTVVAGQQVARSGCSGTCYGPHLHFGVRQPTSTGWRTIDPMAERSWTTWPGRVPFLAAYVRESNASTEIIKRGATITHWVEFRNTGGRSWFRDVASSRTGLGTWSPAGRTSGFRASDWPSSWVATWLDTAMVAPDQVGRFTFGLRASVNPGSYTEAFNLRTDPLVWFDAARLGNFYVPIVVITNQLE